MFLELTDLLTCPRCGPQHGLVLLVEEVQERRVRRGWLGCPRCRTDFRVDGGVADLRLDRESADAARHPVSEDELALKIVALSGLGRERGYLLLGDRLGQAAPSVAQLAPELEIIAVSREPPLEERGDADRLSWIVSDVHYPLLEYRLQGVVIAPGNDREVTAAAARRVAVGGRLVIFDAGGEDLEEVERAGLTILAAEGGTAVAERRDLFKPESPLEG